MMAATNIMVIAGEPSGDALAAELVTALKAAAPASAQGVSFFGAGGPRMAAAGVDLAFDLTQHSVIGLWEAVRNYANFKRLFDQLLRLAQHRVPDMILCVDFSGFNRRFARAVRKYTRARHSRFFSWNPKIVQYVSPQVWASRPGRAKAMARDYDLLLSIFPFERDWYAQRVPQLRVEFVGHPMLDRFDREGPTPNAHNPTGRAEVLLLPGSRVGELRQHLPVMIAAAQRIAGQCDAGFRMVLPDAKLAGAARATPAPPAGLEIQVGNLPDALRGATVAIASTGTVTMECALFGVPSVTLYKTSWSTYQIGKRLVTVKFLAMPNILADEPVFPEFIQDAATAENLATAALELLRDGARRAAVKTRLAQVIGMLGKPGASRRAAQAIWNLHAQPAAPCWTPTSRVDSSASLRTLLK